MKFFQSKNNLDWIELLACDQLPGEDEKTEGITIRAVIPPKPEDEKAPTPLPEIIHLQTGALQSFPDSHYFELDLVDFRRLYNRIGSGFAMVFHNLSRQAFPDIYINFKEEVHAFEMDGSL